MAALGQYVFCIAAAALVCGILCGLLKDSGAYGLVRVVCGLFLTLTVLRPAADFSLEELSRFQLPYSQEAAEAVSIGEEHTREALREIIKGETQAYILDKANELGVQLQVQVTVSEDSIPVPVSVRISGAISPYNRQKLQQIIEIDLNISKENQIWIG